MAEPDLWRVVRFGAVGLLNTGFSFGLYLVLVWLGLHFAAANALATVAGVLFSFRTQGRFVWGDTRWRVLWRFVPVWVGLYAVNVTLIAALMRLDLNAYAAGALALPPTLILSYLVQKRFVFEPGPSNRSVELP